MMAQFFIVLSRYGEVAPLFTPHWSHTSRKGFHDTVWWPYWDRQVLNSSAFVYISRLPKPGEVIWTSQTRPTPYQWLTLFVSSTIKCKRSNIVYRQGRRKCLWREISRRQVTWLSRCLVFFWLHFWLGSKTEITRNLKHTGAGVVSMANRWAFMVRIVPI